MCVCVRERERSRATTSKNVPWNESNYKDKDNKKILKRDVKGHEQLLLKSKETQD